MRKIAVANRKGGVGKSTTAVHLAYGLTKVNYKVLLIDTDSQANCSTMLGVEPEKGLADLVLHNDKDCFIEARENLFLLSGSQGIARVNKEISFTTEDAQYLLRDALRPFEDQFDYAIIDTSPSYSELSINVFYYADFLLVPISIEILAVEGFKQLLREKSISNSGIELKWILPCMVDMRTGLQEDIIIGLQTSFNGKVCHPIPILQLMKEIARKGKVIFEVDDKARPAIAYAKLTGKVLKDET